MAFFDRPNIYPPPQGKIKLQEFDNNDDRAFEHGIDGSGDYAVNKGAILCFLCDYNFMNLDYRDDDFIPAEEGESPTDKPFKYYQSKRLVAFKGFVEDLQIKLNISYTDEGGFNSVVKSKYLEDYLLGYTLTFNVVAHSVNDAVSNANRFAELERMITYPFNSGYNLGDSNEANKVPNSYVFLSNLINSGILRYTGPNQEDIIITNEFVRKHGLRLAVESIKMDPDLDMGVFEFNNKTYFKAFKINLDIPITNIPFLASYERELEYVDRIKTLIPYVLTSSVEGDTTVKFYDNKNRPAFDNDAIPENVFDSRGFPFCILPETNKILTSYAQGVRAYGANKHMKLGICINDSEITIDNNPYITKNYCVFDAFIESFSYEKRQSRSVDANWSDPVASSQVIGSSGEISFNLSLNIPAYSVVDGEANCMKINSLFRMVPISYYKELPGGPIKVLLNNLIKDPNSRGSKGTYDFNDIFTNGLACEVASMNINIDGEAGYFESNGFFIPKAIKLDLQLIVPHKIFGSILIDELDDDLQPSNTQPYNSSDSRYWPML